MLVSFEALLKEYFNRLDTQADQINAQIDNIQKEIHQSKPEMTKEITDSRTRLRSLEKKVNEQTNHKIDQLWILTNLCVVALTSMLVKFIFDTVPFLNP